MKGTRWWLGLAVAAGVVASASSVALLATSAWLISRASQHPPVLELTVAIVGVRAFAVSRSGFRYAERVAGHDAALRRLGETRTRLYRTLERLVPAGLPREPAERAEPGERADPAGRAQPAGRAAFTRDEGQRQRTGDLLHRLVSDVDATVDVLVRVALPAVTAAIVGLGAAVVLGLLLPTAGAVVGVGVVVVLVGVPVLQRVVAGRATRRLAPARAELTARTVELLHGLPDLLAFGAADDYLRAIEEGDRAHRRDEARAARTEGMTAALVTLVGGAAVWLVLWWASAAVRAGALDGVLLATLTLAPLAVFEVLSVLPASARHAESARPALGRLDLIMRSQERTPDPETPAPMPEANELRLENVTATWDGEEPVVTSLSLDLAPGRRVALVGRSGSGKSTVAALLVRFLDPVGGRVTLGGVDLRDLDGDEVRRRVTLLDSDAHLFDTTIEGNLRVAKPQATVDELWGALERARLSEWVGSLKDGLSTRVGENGSKVSGGQRRRIALARALLTGAPVYVLDEPTEHLDEATAERITEDLLAATDGRTVVLITHRPYGLSQVDEVVRLG
jgi:thiol reductant ABC exporter CydC subunit